MALSFDAWRLRALLRITAILLARGIRTSPRLQTMLGEDSFVFQIATEGGSGGHFVLREGRLAYRPGLHRAPDFAQVWKTPG